jgi:hypothetical protein
MAPFEELPAASDPFGGKVDNFKSALPTAQAETFLAHEHARLLHENNLLRVMHENQRLAQENMMLLRLQSQTVPPPSYTWSPVAAGWPTSMYQVPSASPTKPHEARKGVARKFQQKKASESPNSTSGDEDVRSSALALSISASAGKSQEARHNTTNRHNIAEMPQCRTTVMLRNIPIEYTRGFLVDMMHKYGYDGKFNLVYMPMDFQNRVGLGYAFINFESTEIAEAFYQQFTGFKDWAVESDRVCELRWSDVQGLEAHFERYRNSPVMHESVPDEYQPAIFNGSERVPFPPPTKLIRAPRHWNRPK